MKKRLPIYLIVVLLVIFIYQFYYLHATQKSIGRDLKHNLRNLNVREKILYDDLQQLSLSSEYDDVLLLYSKASALHTGYECLPNSLSLYSDHYYKIMQDLYSIADLIKQDTVSETEDIKIKNIQKRAEFLLNTSKEINDELGDYERDNEKQYYREFYQYKGKLNSRIKKQHSNFLKDTKLPL